MLVENNLYSNLSFYSIKQDDNRIKISSISSNANLNCLNK